MITFRVYPRDFQRIQADVGGFMPNYVRDVLSTGLSDDIKTVILEYPYVENDYRDTYYNDFSKRFAYFDKNSVRLHFFDVEIPNVDLIVENQEHYLGFITLRDTKINTIGRSYLSPNAIRNVRNIFCVLAEYIVHIKGYELKVKAFPWMQQDVNVSVCAHIATWSVIRYFSHKYTYYPQRTLYQIVNLLSANTRKTPSTGLTVLQMSEILSKSAFYPEIYLRKVIDEAFSDNSFDKFLYVLIESGIPYIAGTSNHAFVVIGHGQLSKAKPQNLLDSLVACVQNSHIIDSSELVNELITSNDNYLPYATVTKNKGTNNLSYKDITSITVPFYEKMFLDIKSIYALVIPSIEGVLFKLNGNHIRRVLLTSSKSLKKFINEISQDAIYKDIISRQHLPKFVWLIEYATPENFDNGLISHRVIIDASALSNYSDGLGVVINIKSENVITINQTLHTPNYTQPYVSYNLDHITEKQYINNLQQV